MGAVVHSPDRVLRPLRRSGAPGEFTEVSWDQALDDIAQRLKACVRAWGGESVALYHGNPAAFAVSTGRWAGALMSGVAARI
jgi:formate dehydrogenase